MRTTDDRTQGKRHQMIAEAAYFRAENREFRGGDALRDWYEAEAEIDAQLRPTGRRREANRQLSMSKKESALLTGL